MRRVPRSRRDRRALVRWGCGSAGEPIGRRRRSGRRAAGRTGRHGRDLEGAAATAIDAIITLDTLRCLDHGDETRSEPYLWTALTWVELDGLEYKFGMSAPPASVGARAVVKKSMKKGERATMPEGQRRFTHRFPDGVVGGVGMVAVLLEEDDLDLGEVRKGYAVFVRELSNVVGSFIESNDREPNEAELPDLVDTIRRRVTRAIKGALSGWEKLIGVLGFIDEDDFVGFASHSTMALGPGVDEPLTLDFTKKVVVPHVIGQPSGGNPVFGEPIEIVTHFVVDGRVVLQNPVVTGPIRPKLPPKLPVPTPPSEPPAPPRPRPRPPGTREP